MTIEKTLATDLAREAQQHMADLPKEIIENILIRLPAKSLVCFASVCKLWLSLIYDPNFVTTHLNHVLTDPHNNHRRLILKSHSPHYFYSLDYESLNFKPVQHHFPLKPPNGLKVLGSCNGLLCVGLSNSYLGYESIVLWNPLFRDFNKLPESKLFVGVVHIIGFGYDSSTDDYKVVRVVANSRNIQKRKHGVEVYTRKTRSWKKVDDIPFESTCVNPLVGIHVNGTVYWHVTQYCVVSGTYSHMVACFDLADEKFRLMRLPPDFDESWAMCLMTVRGCLGVFEKHYSDPNSVVVWLMKEGEKGASWRLLMDIPCPEGMLSEPLCVMKNDEVLMSVSHNVVGAEFSLISLGEFTNRKNIVGNRLNLVVYNPERGTFRNVLFDGTGVCVEDTTFIETLISPNGGSH